MIVRCVAIFRKNDKRKKRKKEKKKYLKLSKRDLCSQPYTNSFKQLTYYEPPVLKRAVDLICVPKRSPRARDINGLK